MGGILAAIEHSAITEIVEGDMAWRIRKICSADLARVGHAALMMAQGLESNPEDDETSTDDMQKLMASAPVENLQAMARLKDAVVAAGLMAVGNTTSGDWEEVQGVTERDKSDAANGVLWVGAIPNDISDKLFSGIMALSTDGGAALDRLRAFREGPIKPSNPRPNRKKVRRSAK